MDATQEVGRMSFWRLPAPQGFTDARQIPTPGACAAGFRECWKTQCFVFAPQLPPVCVLRPMVSSPCPVRAPAKPSQIPFHRNCHLSMPQHVQNGLSIRAYSSLLETAMLIVQSPATGRLGDDIGAVALRAFQGANSGGQRKVTSEARLEVSLTADLYKITLGKHRSGSNIGLTLSLVLSLLKQLEIWISALSRVFARQYGSV